MGKKKPSKKRAPYAQERDPRGFYWWQMDLIQPNKKQPRQYFAEESMAALRDSISRLGILNPLIIKPLNEFGEAILVDGERRFRCAQELQMEKVPVFLASKEESDIFRSSVVLNFCREEMTEIETAKALQYLMEKYGYSQTEIAALIGKSQGWVSQKLKYLNLCPEVASLLAVRKIAPSIALVVASYPLEIQEKLVRMLQDEVRKKGGPLTPQEASILVRKHGESLDVSPRKARKGRESLGYATRMVLQITRRSNTLSADLRTLLKEVPKEHLKEVGAEKLLNLEKALRDLSGNFGKAIEKLRVIL